MFVKGEHASELDRDTMTEGEAIERARHEADARYWPWDEPVKVRKRRVFVLGPARWRVSSRANARGGGVVVVIDDASGRILRAHRGRH